MVFAEFNLTQTTLTPTFDLEQEEKMEVLLDAGDALTAKEALLQVSGP